MLSAFELYRVGPGPSSKLIGAPMRAAQAFSGTLHAAGLVGRTRRVQIDYFGAAAVAGRAIGIDAAVLAALSGDSPEASDGPRLHARAASVRKAGALRLAGNTVIRFDPERDIAYRDQPGYRAALRLRSLDGTGAELLSRVYHLASDGAIVVESETPPAPARVPFAFADAAELASLAEQERKKIGDMVRANELARHSPEEIQRFLVGVADFMDDSVRRGLAASGSLPRGGYSRRAAARADAQRGRDPEEPDRAATYALAVAEENAAGGRVVAVPTNGSAGPLAGVLHQWRGQHPIGEAAGVVGFLLTAAAIANVLRPAPLRDPGSQAHLGVAAAMAAAGLVAAHGASNMHQLLAAELALQHYVGLPRDPADDLMQQACIDGNAHAAAQAVASARLAMSRPRPTITTLDNVRRAMEESAFTLHERPKRGTGAPLAGHAVGS